MVCGHATSGVYTIHPEACGPPFHVYCDKDTDGGGWTVGIECVFQSKQCPTLTFFLHSGNSFKRVILIYEVFGPTFKVTEYNRNNIRSSGRYN